MTPSCWTDPGEYSGPAILVTRSIPGVSGHTNNNLDSRCRCLGQLSNPTATLELCLPLLPAPLSGYAALHLYSLPRDFVLVPVTCSSCLLPSIAAKDESMLHCGNITQAHSLVALTEDLEGFEVSRLRGGYPHGHIDVQDSERTSLGCERMARTTDFDSRS